MRKNVDISDPGFGERLKTLRRRKGLSRRDVADAIGVSARAYTNWETGKQGTAMEHNVLRLAEFLEVDFDYLVSGAESSAAEAPANPGPAPSSPPPRRWWRLPLGVLAVVIALLAAYTYWPVDGDLDVSGGSVTARTLLLNTPRWSADHDSEVAASRVMDCGDERIVLYGLSGDFPDTGWLLARRARDGAILWKDQPNFVETERVFGPIGAQPPGFGVRRVETGDLDGDGRPEIVARFGHNLWYPSYVRAYRCDGSIVGTYYHCGSIYDMSVVDLDGDDRDEILVAATNNGREYQGATLFILDDKHINGASSDSLMMTECPLDDSSLVRVVFPAWDERFMALCGSDNDGARLSAERLKVGLNGGGAVIAADIMISDWPLVMTLDGELNALSVSPSDTFKRLMETWSEEDRRDFLDYLDTWKDKPYRYGALATAP